MTDDMPRSDQTPQVLPYSGPTGPGGGLRCRNCGGPAKAVSFTWWGGLIGPKMFSHTKCQACGFTFNAKTGRSNNTAIAIYVTVCLVVAIGIGIAYAIGR